MSKQDKKIDKIIELLKLSLTLEDTEILNSVILTVIDMLEEEKNKSKK